MLLVFLCESGLRHHRNINRRQRTSFFVSKIQCLQGFFPLFSLPKYTKVNPHQVPAVGISRLDNSLYQRKEINHGSY